MLDPKDYEYLFCDMKTSSEEDAHTYIQDPTKIYEKKYDGTFGCVIAEQTGHEKNVQIIGRGVLKSGEQQEYSENFPVR